MSKLLHLWNSLSDKNIIRLRNDSICLEGVRKIVSNDDAFLLGLACAELVENLRLVANSVSRISRHCDGDNLRSFERIFREFADSGRDPHCWVLSSKDMEARSKKMDRYATWTATIYKEMDELSVMESGLRKALLDGDAAAIKEHKIIDLQQKIFWKRQEIKYLKDRSLWNRSFDSVTSMLVRSIFTVLARIKLVFGVGVGVGHGSGSFPASLPRSLSATVHPSNPTPNSYNNFVSGPLTMTNDTKCSSQNACIDFFEANSKLLKPPETTLEALGKILGWLSPLAHNMIKWQSERSMEHQKSVPKTNVMLFQTLLLASRDKAEAAITELLVGLNYIWRFEREMTAKALFECSNFNNASAVFLFNKSCSNSRHPDSSLRSAMVS